MRIVMDLQGAQTESRFRGIGRYSLALAQAIARLDHGHEMYVVLNGLFPETIEPLRTAFDGLIPQENIRVWFAPGPVRECNPANAWRRKTAEMVREAFIAELKPDVVHLSAFFDSFYYDAVTSIGALDQKSSVVVTLYDLIPLLNPSDYIDRDPLLKQSYLRSIEELKNAEAWLAISSSTAQEGIEHLGLDPDRVFNISSGCDLQTDCPTVATTVLEKFNIGKSFVLCAGGSDSRKNLHRLIRAYAMLSDSLRSQLQLVLVGKMPSKDVSSLTRTARSAGLRSKEVVFTGYVSDQDLVLLYRLCSLFVFPSWHEGFGLPALEAMKCKAPVIAANTSSLPEVVSLPEALFDPFSVESIADKMSEALCSQAFRDRLVDNASQQAQRFSWESSAREALKAFESVGSGHGQGAEAGFIKTRPRLAYISPLPPARSGIADYSAQLLPALYDYYDIEVVTDQKQVSDEWIGRNCPIRSVQWLKRHAHAFDRILYHVGNSEHHWHMLELVAEVPGVVCLHDFFLSGLLRHAEFSHWEEHVWSRALYESHGWRAVRERFHAPDPKGVMYAYPCNMDLIRAARKVLVHSTHAAGLAKQWYGPEVGEGLEVLPLVRSSACLPGREQARNRLGIAGDDFLVCSFGQLDQTKQNHRLIKAWLSSELSRDPSCRLVFVGGHPEEPYAESLSDLIQGAPFPEHIMVTGWVEQDLYRAYLAAADAAVQLRTLSRGETSAAALDCLNASLATIVNANGSQAEFPKDAVWMIPDGFSDSELRDALEGLRFDSQARQRLAQAAGKFAHMHHTPKACAKRFAQAIEGAYTQQRPNRNDLITSLASISAGQPDRDLRALAAAVAQNQPGPRPAKNLFIDVSATRKSDRRTGIERVTNSLVLEMVKAPPNGYRIEPVYLLERDGNCQYRYARDYALELLECPRGWLHDEPIQPQPGDVLLAADLEASQVVQAEKAGLFDRLRQIGVRINFIIFDLLPVHKPECFPPGTQQAFVSWLASVCRIADQLLCISRTVAQDMRDWLMENGPYRHREPRVNWFHLGADFEPLANPIPTGKKGRTEQDEHVLQACTMRPSVLMVGTIEPRKGHHLALQAFERLWERGFDLNLVIVGREGWSDMPDAMRRTIPNVVDALRTHAQSGNSLFWLSEADDAMLERLYAACACLLAASEDEGFGLPLIEAAQRNLPLLARDIPVFREVARDHAMYFQGDDPAALASAIESWLRFYEQDLHPKSENMPWLTWEQSAQRLKALLCP